jgi:RNA polymerase sigma-70 factor (ECF subfamily)
MEQEQMLAQIRSAVRALPSRQRSALLMRKYQGMSYEEVGKALGCTSDAARAHVYQALRRLRSRFPARASQEGSQR